MSAFLLFEAFESAINSRQPQKARHFKRELAKLGWIVDYKPEQKRTEMKEPKKAT